MKKILTLLAVVLTLSLASYAQLSNETQTEKRVSGKISGTVIDGSTKTIESATIAFRVQLVVKPVKVPREDAFQRTARFQHANNVSLLHR